MEGSERFVELMEESLISHGEEGDCVKFLGAKAKQEVRPTSLSF